MLCSRCDTEVVLASYLAWGPDCARRLQGIFAFAIYDPAAPRLLLCRDPFGVKPLFLTRWQGRLAFASEIKALFQLPGVRPVVDKDGLREVFALGPARTPGCGVFQGIWELKPGHLALLDPLGYRELAYFQLEARPHEEDYPHTVSHLRELLLETVERQLQSDVPLCAFLSGGLDSSVVTAIAAQRLKERGQRLATYSFEFEGNREFFTPSAFQPGRDQEWALRVSGLLSTEHTSLVCGREEMRKLIDSLPDTLVVLDEAYMDFSDQSLLGEVEDHPNLLVLRTCSKAFGMAALRLGFAVCGKTLAGALRAVKSPYNVNSLSQAVGTAVLRRKGELDRALETILRSRDQLYAGLRELGEKYPGRFRLLPGETNFAAMEMEDGPELLAYLARQGVAIRYTGGLVRVTCGAPEENKIVLEEMAGYFAQPERM